MDFMRKAEDESKKQESALATKVSSNEVEVCICDLILVITLISEKMLLSSGQTIGQTSPSFSNTIKSRMSVLK